MIIFDIKHNMRNETGGTGCNRTDKIGPEPDRMSPNKRVHPQGGTPIPGTPNAERRQRPSRPVPSVSEPTPRRVGTDEMCNDAINRSIPASITTV